MLKGSKKKPILRRQKLISHEQINHLPVGYMYGLFTYICLMFIVISKGSLNPQWPGVILRTRNTPASYRFVHPKPLEGPSDP